MADAHAGEDVTMPIMIVQDLVLAMQGSKIVAEEFRILGPDRARQLLPLGAVCMIPADGSGDSKRCFLEVGINYGTHSKDFDQDVSARTF